MYRVTIRSFGRDDDEKRNLSDLAARYFPGEKVVKCSPDLCVLDVEGPMAQYLVDELRNAADEPSFDSYRDWEQRQEDQFPIVFDSPKKHVEDPIDATAG